MLDYISTSSINFFGISLEIFGSVLLAYEFYRRPKYTILVQETNVEGTPPGEYRLGKAEVEKYYQERDNKRKVKFGVYGSIFIFFGLIFQLWGIIK